MLTINTRGISLLISHLSKTNCGIISWFSQHKETLNCTRSIEPFLEPPAIRRSSKTVEVMKMAVVQACGLSHGLIDVIKTHLIGMDISDISDISD